MSNFDFKKYLSKNPLLKENQVNNKYVVKDEELSDEYGDFYTIDQKKAFEYLKQFNNSEVSAKQFIKDDEGWGEFEQYLDDVVQMSDEELENAMRQEMSYYFFSNPDSIGESKLHEEEQVDPQVDTLQQALGVKVAPSDSNSERLIIYPDSAPDREKYYDSRSAQRISILAKDGKYYLLSAFGYGRSISSIAVVVGSEPQSTGFAGFKAIDVSMKKPEVNTTLLKMYVRYMQQGLKDESNDQRDFYKGWSNPD